MLSSSLSPAWFASGVSFSITGPVISGFDVTATCVEDEVTEGVDMYSVFDPTVQAEFAAPGQEDDGRRTLVASVSTLP